MKRILMWAMMAVCLAGGATRAQAQAFIVVANANASVSTLSKSELSQIFLKRNTRLAPVDLSKDSKVRDAFSRAVFSRPAQALSAYWQQQIFAGKDVPPPEKATDDEVLAYVRNTPNGVGYVAAGTALGNGVKVVSVE